MPGRFIPRRMTLVRFYVVVAAMVLAGSASSGVVAGVITHSGDDTTLRRIEVADRRISSAAAVAQSARQAIRLVQASRLEACRDANGRHDATIRELDRLLKSLHGRARRRARAKRASTVALLSAIAPHIDCGKRVTSP